jgi:polysaccharide biosynthesis transport protein
MNGDKELTGRRVSLRDVLFIFFYKISVFETIIAFIVVATIALVLLATPVYLVTGQILVKPLLDSNLKLLAPTATNIRANPVTPQDVNSEVNILKSPQLLREVVNKLQLYKEPEPSSFQERLERSIRDTIRHYLIAWGLSAHVTPEDRALQELAKKLEIKPITLSNSIEISLTGDSPEGITVIVNTLMDRYLGYRINLFKAKGAKEFYADQAEFFRKKLDEAESNLEQFKKDWSIIEINAQNENNVILLKLFRENLGLTNAQIKDRQTKVAVQAKNLATTGNVGAFTKDLQSNILEELVRTLGPLLAERERIAVHYQKDSIKYQAIESQVDELKQRYDKQIKELIKGAELDLTGLKKYAKALQDNINNLEKQSVLLSQQQIELDKLWREVKQYEKHYLLYLDKTEEARIEERQQANQVSNVTITNRAEVPTIPVFPKKIFMILLSVVIGSIVGLAGAFFSYYMDHAVKTPEELAWYSGLPLLAAIRKLPVPEEQPVGLIQLSEPPLPILWMEKPINNKGLLEDFNTLKNNLALKGKKQGFRVYLCTGPNPEVGVSTTCFNLAVLLAQDFPDQRILLVDTNLSDPAVHRVFNKSISPGLLEYLCDNLPLSQIIQTWSPPPQASQAAAEHKAAPFKSNLDLVALGSFTTQLLSPFDLRRFQEFISEVKADYDLVLLDGPPVFTSSHSLIISNYVDGIILAVEACHTRYEVVVNMKNLLERHGKIVGGVLNKRRFVIPAYVYRFL